MVFVLLSPYIAKLMASSRFVLHFSYSKFLFINSYFIIELVGYNIMVFQVNFQ